MTWASTAPSNLLQQDGLGVGASISAVLKLAPLKSQQVRSAASRAAPGKSAPESVLEFSENGSRHENGSSQGNGLVFSRLGRGVVAGEGAAQEQFSNTRVVQDFVRRTGKGETPLFKHQRIVGNCQSAAGVLLYHHDGDA